MVNTMNKTFKFDNLNRAILVNGGNPSAKYIRRYLIDKGYITEDFVTTIAKINKDTGKANKRYWANPDIDFLKKDWVLVLNDNVNRILYIFKIPANSINRNDINTRIMHNRLLMDIEIIRVNDRFESVTSDFTFDKWLDQTVKY